MDYEDLEKKIDGRTKMIILCSPHNPVGRVWKRGRNSSNLSKSVRKKDIVIVSDEIHLDLILGKIKHTPHCIALREGDAEDRDPGRSKQDLQPRWAI